MVAKTRWGILGTGWIADLFVKAHQRLAGLLVDQEPAVARRRPLEAKAALTGGAAVSPYGIPVGGRSLASSGWSAVSSTGLAAAAVLQ